MVCVLPTADTSTELFTASMSFQVVSIRSFTATAERRLAVEKQEDGRQPYGSIPPSFGSSNGRTMTLPLRRIYAYERTISLHSYIIMCVFREDCEEFSKFSWRSRYKPNVGFTCFLAGRGPAKHSDEYTPPQSHTRAVGAHASPGDALSLRENTPHQILGEMAP